MNRIHRHAVRTKKNIFVRMYVCMFFYFSAATAQIKAQKLGLNNDGTLNVKYYQHSINNKGVCLYQGHHTSN